MKRRNVLKTVGAVSLLSAASGASAAQQEGPGNGGGATAGQGQSQAECPRPNCIHPTLGYVGLEADEAVPATLEADHVVDCVTQPPEEGDTRPLPEFYFEPTGLYVEPGDVVRFNLATPDHTITAYHPGLGRQRRVPEGVPAFSSPVLSGDAYWLYRFDTPGVYDYLCAPHEIFGMVGRIVVGDAEADFGEVGPEYRPPELTAGLVIEDPALEPDNIRSEEQVSWEDISDDNKVLLVEIVEIEE